MNLRSKIVSAAVKVTNSNAFINTGLLACCLVLSAKSRSQYQQIEALQSERDSLTNSNKAIRKTLWNWKQQLFAEASVDSPLISLATVKSIYGDESPPGNSDHFVTLFHRYFRLCFLLLLLKCVVWFCQ